MEKRLANPFALSSDRPATATTCMSCILHTCMNQHIYDTGTQVVTVTEFVMASPGTWEFSLKRT